MLYEPPKTKQYILIGASAIVLAFLAIVIIPLIFKGNSLPTPVSKLSPKEKLEQQKIQAEFENLEAMRKSANIKEPTQEEIQREFAELEKQRAESNATEPTPEQIQAEFEELEQMKK